MTIKVTPLGAGQDVGRSCILVTIGGKNIMFDCGMHMGYNDERRFPDFSFISKRKEFNRAIDCVIISHFHLDHCGALPYFTEVCGYDGPVYMTHPTKAICPILLEDYRKIMVDRKGETNFFKSEDIKNCMKKVVGVNLHQSVKVDDQLEIQAYYAGHVLGAAMFYVKVGSESVVYTGDFNMTPDRHLGAAQVNKLRPDLLITETTYATTIRDSKRSRERDFLKQVHQCVEKGGKVLIPVFALGRAQELCILLETYWERMNLSVPIYFSAGLVEKANFYYQLFISWTNQKIKTTFDKRNMFDFKHIQSCDRTVADRPGPCVLFATPGMLHAGMSLEVFKKWAPFEQNMIIIPGYCVAGTVGNKVLTSKGGPIEVDKRTTIDMKCQVRNLSFSAHADAKGILQLIRQAEPRNVVLVHGEKAKMGFLKQKIISDFGIGCFDPANGSTVVIETRPPLPINISVDLLKRSIRQATEKAQLEASSSGDALSQPCETADVEGILVLRQNMPPFLLDAQEAQRELNIRPHKVRFSLVKQLPSVKLESPTTTADEKRPAMDLIQTGGSSSSGSMNPSFFADLHKYLNKWMYPSPVALDGSSLTCRSISLTLQDSGKIVVSWSFEDETLANKAISIFDDFIRESMPVC